jgi:MFS family permease
MSPVTATAKGSIVIMATGRVTSVAFPIVGVLLDRWGRAPVLICGLIVGGIGFCLAGMITNPFSLAMYPFIALTVAGLSGAMAGAKTLTSDASPRPLVGSILGGLNTMQPLGVLIFLQVGGFLFDKVGFGAPFVLKGVANLVCGLWILAVRKGIVVTRDEGSVGEQVVVQG